MAVSGRGWKRNLVQEEDGFTLIEVIVAIVIIAVLTSLVVVVFQNLTSEATAASCATVSKTVEYAMETYKGQVGHYPMIGSADVTGDNWAPEPGSSQVSGATPSTFVDGLDAMYTTQPGLDGNDDGPWLKDAAVYSGHYRFWIVATATGTGDTILVQNLSTQPLDTASSPITLDAGGVLTWDGTEWVPSLSTGQTAGQPDTCASAGL